MPTTAKAFNLASYYPQLFSEAMISRYRSDCKPGFERIEAHYAQIREGRDLVIEDVMTLFDDDLPFCDAWTKPEATDLTGRIEKGKVAALLKGLSRTFAP